jgi:hypothetical protein
MCERRALLSNTGSKKLIKKDLHGRPQRGAGATTSDAVSADRRVGEPWRGVAGTRVTIYRILICRRLALSGVCGWGQPLTYDFSDHG